MKKWIKKAVSIQTHIYFEDEDAAMKAEKKLMKARKESMMIDPETADRIRISRVRNSVFVDGDVSSAREFLGDL